MNPSSAMSRTLAAIGVLTVTFLGYNYYSQRTYSALIEEQKQRAEEERQRAEQYRSQLRTVLAERKTTRFRVIRTEKVSPDAKAPPKHTLRIGQWNDKAEKIFSRDIQITGNKIYFEGVVIHFQPELITQGRTNLHMLTRVFSDTVPPSEGVSLIDDQIQAADLRLAAELPMLDQQRKVEVQRYLQRIAQDPDFARREGVRTVNGQATADYQDLSESYVYTIVEKADGGYLIEKAPIP